MVEQIEKSQAALRKLQRVVRGVYVLSVDFEDLSSWVHQYRRQIVSLFEDSGGQILSYPNVGHQELVSRAVAQTKPFGGKNDGYRDCLIWFSVLEALQAAKDNELEFIYFGTANTSDFSDGKSGSLRLHADLVEDLSNRKFLEDDVILFGSLGEIISNQIRFRVAELSMIQERILNRRWKQGDFEYAIESAVGTFLQARPNLFMQAQEDWVDIEVETSRVVEYQDATVEMIENGFFRVHVDVVCDSVVIWEPGDDTTFPQDLSVEKLDTPWGTRFRTSVTSSATVSYVFDDQWEEVSAAVWQDDPLDIELLTVAS